MPLRDLSHAPADAPTADQAADQAADRPVGDDERSSRPAPTRLAAWLAVWSLGYAGYRAYYALGGDLGMIGVPVSESDFRAVNAVGAVIIALAGALAWVLPRVAALRSTVPVVGWLGCVGCVMHALVDMTLSALSVTGVNPMERPADFWASVHERTADLQDLFLNEPWFLVEGLLWGALGLAYVAASRRRRWLVSAAAAVAALTAVGILSGLDVIGSLVVL